VCAQQLQLTGSSADGMDTNVEYDSGQKSLQRDVRSTPEIDDDDINVVMRDDIREYHCSMFYQ
jgi:hypothetical protein